MAIRLQNRQRTGDFMAKPNAIFGIHQMFSPIEEWIESQLADKDTLWLNGDPVFKSYSERDAYVPIVAAIRVVYEWNKFARENGVNVSAMPYTEQQIKALRHDVLLPQSTMEHTQRELLQWRRELTVMKMGLRSKITKQFHLMLKENENFQRLIAA